MAIFKSRRGCPAVVIGESRKRAFAVVEARGPWIEFEVSEIDVEPWETIAT